MLARARHASRLARLLYVCGNCGSSNSSHVLVAQGISFLRVSALLLCAIPSPIAHLHCWECMPRDAAGCKQGNGSRRAAP